MVATMILAAVVALACIGGVVRWAWLARANARVIGAPPGERRVIFHGGVMGRHLLTSGLLVRLEFFDWGVRLSGLPVIGRLLPTWEASFDELAIAERVTLPASRIAVWLRLRDDAGGIGFLGGDSQEILTRLQDRGVPVNRAITQVKRVEELYQQ